MGSKILITGSSGFIGSHVVEDPLENGYEVAGLDASDPEQENRIEFIKADTRNKKRFPSPYEGFDLPILKAQARGLPVVIYEYGKIPKEVRKYCFEAESPEHMAQIIKNIKENGYNEKLKKKATEYARSFTWEKTAKETPEAYKKVI